MKYCNLIIAYISYTKSFCVNVFCSRPVVFAIYRDLNAAILLSYAQWLRMVNWFSGLKPSETSLNIAQFAHHFAVDYLAAPELFALLMKNFNKQVGQIYMLEILCFPCNFHLNFKQAKITWKRITL